MSPADRAWIDRALAVRRAMAREIGTAGFSSPATVIFFDAACVLRGRGALAAGRAAWTAEPHAGAVRLPDRRLLPAGVTSFAAEHDGRAFFVMSTPSVWRAKGVPGEPMGLEALMTAVFLHESAHVAQVSTYMRRVSALARANAWPESFDDDSIQRRFRGDAAFAASVARETALLYAAAAAADDAEAHRLAREARALLAARRARWFVGADAHLAEAEDLFLGLEGSGQWVGYRWLVSPDGAGMSRADAIAAFGRRGGWWSQEQGLALILATERIAGPGWRARAFGDGAVAGLAMLDQALDAGGAASRPGRVAPPPSRVALQLHSVRRELERDLPGTLRALRAVGIRRVEFSNLFGRTPAAFDRELRRAGIRAVAAHFPLADFAERPQHIIDVARATGVRDVGVSWIARERRLFIDQADVGRAAAALNAACPALQRAGLRMHYHVHGYEFAPGRTGTLFDDLLAAFAPRCVEIELDVFWAAHGGADPVALLRRLGRRVTMLHLKDISADAGPGRPFAPDADNPPLGTGRIDMQGVLRAARENGVRWYILEDETSMAMARLPGALRYLRAPG